VGRRARRDGLLADILAFVLDLCLVLASMPITEVSGSRKAILSWENACPQASIQQPSSGRLAMAKATGLIGPPTVTGDGEGLVSHAGLVWLGEVATASA
jgi:hypothetical protein